MTHTAQAAPTRSVNYALQNTACVSPCPSGQLVSTDGTTSYADLPMHAHSNHPARNLRSFGLKVKMTHPGRRGSGASASGSSCCWRAARAGSPPAAPAHAAAAWTVPNAPENMFVPAAQGKADLAGKALDHSTLHARDFTLSCRLQMWNLKKAPGRMMTVPEKRKLAE